MSNILFDYRIETGQITCHYPDLEALNLFQLKNIFSGCLYIFFDKDDKNKRNFILLETGILDYINQFDHMISYIDKGNIETFTVSSDCYSNSLNYLYHAKNGILEIDEVNNALFSIRCKYEDFKKTYKKFRKKILDELVMLFPELAKNSIFIAYFSAVNL